MQSVEQQLKVNINTASVDELVMLPGIGKKKAQMLIDFREKNGEFTDIQQITDIKGFGTKLLTKLQDKIVLK
ncbi:helix-hairpin-helix domain-containing protein [Pseudoalteromonas sp. MMG010]|nr:helix-hairpin-helix domain-containing protein [Pseudoalteromonas sp. MMG010]